MKYDPRTACQLETELRANSRGLWCGDSMWRAAGQMAAMREEIERMTAERDNARWADETRKKAAAVIIAERNAMRAVVEAAISYVDSDGSIGAVIDAVSDYRAARDKAGQCIGTIRTQPSNVECIACGKFGQVCDRTRKP